MPPGFSSATISRTFSSGHVAPACRRSKRRPTMSGKKQLRCSNVSALSAATSGAVSACAALCRALQPRAWSGSSSRGQQHAPARAAVAEHAGDVVLCKRDDRLLDVEPERRARRTREQRAERGQVARAAADVEKVVTGLDVERLKADCVDVRRAEVEAELDQADGRVDERVLLLLCGRKPRARQSAHHALELRRVHEVAPAQVVHELVVGAVAVDRARAHQDVEEVLRFERVVRVHGDVRPIAQSNLPRFSGSGLGPTQWLLTPPQSQRAPHCRRCCRVRTTRVSRVCGACDAARAVLRRRVLCLPAHARSREARLCRPRHGDPG
eukprot:Unigene6131_Nuclearia_a/m.18881 Unigene6131_Nuclearia_a/g.18881  ORF Unigene6131_Nuclearia_a/g.18881 Unigene6131_Nuclearia_a/m.18881 type:complete len:325 (+) Unigene6131_Nuclearia_a:884-1858(+)